MTTNYPYYVQTKVKAKTVLITGVSGGVGSVAVLLAKRRGAKVVAIASASKHQHLRELGADQVIDREEGSYWL